MEKIDRTMESVICVEREEVKYIVERKGLNLIID